MDMKTDEDNLHRNTVDTIPKRKHKWLGHGLRHTGMLHYTRKKCYGKKNKDMNAVDLNL